MKIKVTLFFTIIPLIILSQEISGKIYDDKAVVSGVKITNITQNKITYTDENGDFKIVGALNDSIHFYSLFHKEQIIKITKGHLKEVFVVELKKITNNLDEVLLNKVLEKEFNQENHSTNFDGQIQEDIKQRPYLYQPPPSGNADILAIVGLVAKLFKSKKPKKEPLIPIGYEAFKTLFATSDFFTESLLKHQLHISDENKYSFFGYCSERGIDSKLLSKNKRILLLEELVKSSNEFLIVMEKNKKRE
ncbi:hypothetical protein D7030_13025 [Flavobacteriaceae bacterium AU392]|nr:hypothetical protein D1817_05465 [Flavobacteriaceae bacterium]RKM81228.1 hypothetical protein D7030_13025 [Flavobacteriaceae bacterium AU392]